jgi:hypothetical protein
MRSLIRHLISTLRLSAAIAIILTLWGCGTTQNLQPGAPISIENGTSILVMGLSPKYRIHLIRGSLELDSWVRPKLDVPEINVFPDNGYLIIKAKPTATDQRMGIATIFPDGKVYGPCNNSIGPTFELKAGTVNYVGDLNYKFDGTNLTYSITVNEDAARKFVESNYPSVAGNFETHAMKTMRVKSNFCDPKTIIIPIYVPGR